MNKAYVVGTFDTKAVELNYIAERIRAGGVEVVRVDLSTQGAGSEVEIAPEAVAQFHPHGVRAVLGQSERGVAVRAMATAFERMVRAGLDGCGGMIGAGGSGGTSMVAPAMQALPVGTPKLLVSTVASGNVQPYVGPADIAMMYAVTDVQGLNRISRRVLGNAANAMAGMVRGAADIVSESAKPAIGLTMFGVTTPCVQAVAAALEDRFDCLVFHATGTGGRSMEKLVESGLVSGVLDLTTTEIADLVGGGIFSAGEDRMDVFAEYAIPYVGSCGALDMVNFGAPDTIKGYFKHRLFYEHNSQVTLMRTDLDECRQIGVFIADKLNAMPGKVRFLIPEKGVSMLDNAGQAFENNEADMLLFETIVKHVEPSDNRRIVRVNHHINDPEFAAVAVSEFLDIMN